MKLETREALRQTVRKEEPGILEALKELAHLCFNSDCSSLLTIPFHVFREEGCRDEEPCSAGRMQALPFTEGCDTLQPKENSD